MQFNIQASYSHTESDSDSIDLINMPSIRMEKQSSGLSVRKHNRLYYKGPSLGDTWLIDSNCTVFHRWLNSINRKGCWDAVSVCQLLQEANRDGSKTYFQGNGKNENLLLKSLKIEK